MFSILSVLVTSLRPRKASGPIASVCPSMNFFGPPRPRGRARSTRFCAPSATLAGRSYVLLRHHVFIPGATLHSVTGYTSQNPEPSVRQGRLPVSRLSNPLTGTARRPPMHPSRIECHPSAICSAVEPHSSVEQVTVNTRPYFVPSTASASEILTNVALQDSLAQDAETYDLPCQPTNIPSLTSFSDSWDSFEFDFVNPFARDGHSDSDSEAGEDETTDDTLQSPSRPIDIPKQFRGLDTAPSPFLVHINREMQLNSSSVVEVTLRNTRPDSHLREDHGDGEEAIIIPFTPFPHPHLLSPIIEEDEDESSDTETIRPSTSIVGRHGNRLGHMAMQNTAMSYVSSARVLKVTVRCQFKLDVPTRTLSQCA